nr:MAG TPA: hypothetical protein [Caudoviricetes sp.]
MCILNEYHSQPVSKKIIDVLMIMIINMYLLSYICSVNK